MFTKYFIFAFTNVNKYTTNNKQRQYCKRMIKKEELRNYLPKNYAKAIRERLIERTGQKFTRPYIVMVIAGKRNNSIILHEAAVLASEERDRRLQTASILESLSL